MRRERLRRNGPERKALLRKWVEGEIEVVCIYDTAGNRDYAPTTVIEQIGYWGGFDKALASPWLYTSIRQVRKALRESKMSEDRARLIEAQLKGNVFVVDRGEDSWRGYRFGVMPRFEGGDENERV